MILETDNQKIRIFSKKLSSGKCQVKFFGNSKAGKPYYGYVLVDSGKKVSEIISLIYEKLQDIDRPDKLYHGHLYNIGTGLNFDPSFMIFQQDVA